MSAPAKLPSDADVAALCNAIYAYPGYEAVKWDYLSLASSTSFKSSFGVKRLGEVSLLVFRGSESLPDWMRDFDALADPLECLGFKVAGVPEPHEYLGPVHPGFVMGLDAAIDAAAPYLTDTIIVAGHSLGAAEATLATGILMHRGRAPARRVVFGEPRSGMKPLADFIASVPAASYRNGNGDHHDIVPDVPFAIGIEAYVHCCPLEDVCAKPDGTLFERWRLLAWHGMPLYLQALQRMAGQPSDLPKAMLMPTVSA